MQDSVEQMPESQRFARGLSAPQHAQNSASKASTLTVLLENPGDRLIHILLQFGAAEAEAALEGDKTNSHC